MPASGRKKRRWGGCCLFRRQCRAEQSFFSARDLVFRKRRQAVRRYIVEQEGPVSTGQICVALEISPHEARTALNRLLEEGAITRAGTGKATRYTVKPARSVGSGPKKLTSLARKLDTLEGRLLAMIQDRGWVFQDELFQAIDATQEQIVNACGGLIREGEIRMDRRDGRRIYISKGNE